MRKIILPLLASLALASPALAGETRAEVRGGAIWSDGETQDTWGVAAGHDFSLAPMTFAGVEVSGDKIGTDNTKTAWGLTGRVGVKIPTGTKLFAAGGYTTEPCDTCSDSWHAGAGLEQTMFGPFYLKAECRHYFPGNAIPESDSLIAGVGVKF